MSGHRFPGGLRLDPRKLASASPLRVLPLPPRLFVSLLQHAGAPARPCVAVGDRVRKGERIGEATEPLSAHVHAPTSGIVRAIAPRDVGHPAGRHLPCVEIEPDGLDEWQRLAPLAQRASLPRAVLHARLRDAGVVGLGGGVFPADLKLGGETTGIDTLILNGAECEPYIACDDALMRERADDVLAGAALLSYLCGARRTVVAIEDRMHDALAAMRAARDADDAFDSIAIEAVPTRYPQGGERQLVRAITGVELAAGVLPRSRGVLCVNVGTAAAAHRAVVHGEPLVSRIVSVTGRGVARPCNLEVPIGTPVSALVQAAGGYTPDAQRLVVGGPMMGHALPHDEVPIGKGSNCVLVLAADDLRDEVPEMPCIRCGQCADVCPARLLPQQLHFHVAGGEWAKVRALGLPDCIECGLCAYVCPSHIPLVEAFRYGKGELAWQLREAERAKVSKVRFERRQARLALAAKAREERLRARESGALAANLAQAAAAPATKRSATATAAKANQPDTIATGTANGRLAQAGATPPMPSAPARTPLADQNPATEEGSPAVETPGAAQMSMQAARPAAGETLTAAQASTAAERSTAAQTLAAIAPSTRPRPTDAVVAAAIAAARTRATRTDAEPP
jgi:electron transport complex protein RnfC